MIYFIITYVGTSKKIIIVWPYNNLSRHIITTFKEKNITPYFPLIKL